MVKSFCCNQVIAWAGRNTSCLEVLNNPLSLFEDLLIVFNGRNRANIILLNASQQCSLHGFDGKLALFLAFHVSDRFFNSSFTIVIFQLILSILGFHRCKYKDWVSYMIGTS